MVNHQRKLGGIIVPLVTPLSDAKGAIDVPALERVIAHVVGGGVDGLLLLGTTGEGPSLGMEHKRELVRAATAIAGSTAPVYVCITDTALVDALALAEVAASCGASAVVAAPPFYFPVEDEQIVGYYQWMCRSLALPLILYNMPATTRTPLSRRVVERLVRLPGVIGLKDSGGDWEEFHGFQAVQSRQDAEGKAAALLMGDEKLLARAARAGAAGGVCGSGNFAPEVFRHLFAAAAQGNCAERGTLDEFKKQAEAFRELYAIGTGWGRGIANLKYALSCVGLCEPTMALPLTEPREHERMLIEAWLERVSELDGFASVRARMPGKA